MRRAEHAGEPGRPRRDQRSSGRRAEWARGTAGRARSGAPLEEVVGRPTTAGPASVAEQLGARHEEHAPAHPPKAGVAGAVGRCEDRHTSRALRVHVCEPGVRGALRSACRPSASAAAGADRPGSAARRSSLGIMPPEKKWRLIQSLASRVLERIGRGAVHEHVHEEAAAGREPARDPREEARGQLRRCSNISTETMRSKRSVDRRSR